MTDLAYRERSQRKRTGFTLVELLLVIAILIALTAVVYAAFGPVRERARNTTCISNLRQVGQALAMYRADADGEEAVVGKHSSCTDLGLPCSKRLDSFFKEYKLGKEVLVCPDYKGQHGENEYWNSTYVWPMGEDSNDTPYESWLSTRTFKQGEAAIIVYDDSHNRLFSYSKEPNWIKKHVLALQVNGQVRSLYVPLKSFEAEW